MAPKRKPITFVQPIVDNPNSNHLIDQDGDIFEPQIT
jgi:hypothetical protein